MAGQTREAQELIRGPWEESLRQRGLNAASAAHETLPPFWVWMKETFGIYLADVEVRVRFSLLLYERQGGTEAQRFAFSVSLCLCGSWKFPKRSSRYNLLDHIRDGPRGRCAPWCADDTAGSAADDEAAAIADVGARRRSSMVSIAGGKSARRRARKACARGT